MHVVYTENAEKHIEIIQTFIGPILKDNDDDSNATIEIWRQNNVYFRSIICIVVCIIKKWHGERFQNFAYALSKDCCETYRNYLKIYRADFRKWIIKYKFSLKRGRFRNAFFLHKIVYSFDLKWSCINECVRNKIALTLIWLM